MTFLNTFKKALSLLRKGEWRELYIRALLSLGILDFTNVTIDELRLSPEA